MVDLSEDKEGNREFQEDTQMVDVSEDKQGNREFQEDTVTTEVVDLSKYEEEINTVDIVQPQKFIEEPELPGPSLDLVTRITYLSTPFPLVKLDLMVEFGLMSDVENKLAAYISKIDAEARSLYNDWKSEVFSTYDEMMKKRMPQVLVLVLVLFKNLIRLRSGWQKSMSFMVRNLMIFVARHRMKTSLMLRPTLIEF